MKKTGKKYQMKIVTVGNAGVGKTSLIDVYLTGRMRNIYNSTMGVDFLTSTMDMGDTGDTVKIQWWDTAGEERYRSITKSYYRNSSAMILVFDLGDSKSFDELQHWIDEIAEFRVEGQPILLIGNKLDLVNNSTKYGVKKYNNMHEIAQNLADLHSLIYIETSAKLNIRVKDAFDNLITTVYDNAMKSEDPESWNVHNLDNINYRRVNYKNCKNKSQSFCCAV